MKREAARFIPGGFFFACAPVALTSSLFDRLANVDSLAGSQASVVGKIEATTL
jgi:hypothetical protein